MKFFLIKEVKKALDAKESPIKDQILAIFPDTLYHWRTFMLYYYQCCESDKYVKKYLNFLKIYIQSLKNLLP